MTSVVTAHPEVVVEDDPTPLVLQLARLVRRASTDAGLSALTSGGQLCLVVRDRDTPQSATLRFDGGSVSIGHGAASDADRTYVVQVNSCFLVEEADRAADTVDAAVLALLRPALPHWRHAATEFWARTGDGVGMPDVLRVIPADGSEELVLGAGTTSYVVHGEPDRLSEVFSGAAFFLDSVFGGLIQVRGSLPQLSVMAGASNKVRFDG